MSEQKENDSMCKTLIRGVLRAIRFTADLALVLIEDRKETAPTPVPPKAKEPPAPEPVAPPCPSVAERRKRARASIKAIPPIPPETTVNGVVESLAKFIGEPTRHDATSTDWYFGTKRIACSVKTINGTVGITVYDSPSPMTWHLTERHPLDFASRGLFWYLAEMELFPLENTPW